MLARKRRQVIKNLNVIVSFPHHKLAVLNNVLDIYRQQKAELLVNQVLLAVSLVFQKRL